MGSTLKAPGAGLDFTQWLNGFPGGPVPLPGERFVCRDLSSIDGPAGLTPRSATTATARSTAPTRAAGHGSYEPGVLAIPVAGITKMLDSAPLDQVVELLPPFL